MWVFLVMKSGYGREVCPLSMSTPWKSQLPILFLVLLSWSLKSGSSFGTAARETSYKLSGTPSIANRNHSWDFIVRTKILLIPIRWYPRVGTRPPKWQKFPHFGKESPRILWLIATITRKFYAPNYREFRECVLHLTWFASLVTESLVRNRTSLIYPEIFSAPCRKKCALDRKMIHTLLSDSTSSIARQSLREIVIREPALGAKIWCFLPAWCRKAANCRY